MHGKNYLIIVDYFSRGFELEVLVRKNSETIVEKFKVIFARFGIPDILRTDGGPQFTYKYFKCFVNNYSFMREVTDPYFSLANHCADRPVQVAKRLMKTSDPCSSLLAYRNTRLM